MIKNRLHIKTIITIAFVMMCIQKGLAQFITAEIGVDGLTCSQCSRSVEMSLLKLVFIKDVQMDLESTIGKIIFKADAKISFNKVAKAITDAGFSVRYLKATYSFKNSYDTSNFIPLNAFGRFCFVNVKNKALNGEVILTFLGKEFMQKQEHNKWKEAIKKTCGEINKENYYVYTQ